MNDDRGAGSARKFTGKLKDAFGGLTGNGKLQAEGKLDQGAGQIRNTVGRIVDVVRKRPLVAAGVAVVAAWILKPRGR